MSPRSHDEDGAVAIVTAILLTVLIGFAALVIDLGLVRADVRSSQSAADASVTAAGLELDPTVPNSFRSACQAGWTYFLANVDGDPTTPDPCDNFADAVFLQGSITCDSRAAGGAPTSNPSVDAPLYVERAFGQFTFYMQMPVPDSDPLMTGQAANSEFDGDDPCERIGLRISRTRDNLLAGVLGFPTSGSSVDAVSRRVLGGNEKEYATLIVLEPDKCLAIGAQAGTGVIVFNDKDSSVTPPKLTPGVITSDSDGDQCGGTIYDTGGNGYICAGVSPIAPATYTSAAVLIDDGPSGKGVCDIPETELVEGTLRSFDPVPGEWGSDPEGLKPDVVEAPRRVTREPIDHAFNCRTSYPTFSATTPQYYYQDDGNEPKVASCKSRNVAGIDLLVDAYIDGGVVHRTLSGAPTNGFVEVDCSSPTSAAAKVIVNCKKTGSTPLQLTLSGAETVIIEQFASGNSPGVAIGNGEYLRVTPSASAKDAIVVLPEGGINLGGAGELQFNRSFVYLHDADGAGLNSSSSGLVRWTAPAETGWDDSTAPHTAVGCSTYQLGGHTLPTSACFEDLALWSNSTVNPQKLAGQSNIDAEGIFFVPNAGRDAVNGSFALNGGGSGLDLSDAQFFVWRLSLEGQAPVLMRPNPDRFIATPAYGVGLIR